MIQSWTLCMLHCFAVLLVCCSFWRQTWLKLSTESGIWASYMAKPAKGAWAILRHMCGYLDQQHGYCSCISVTQPGAGLTVQKDNEHIVEAYSDSEWAGNHITRRSVSGSCILVNNAVLHGCSKSRKVVAVSSAEAEYHAAVSCAIDGILIRSMIEFVYPGNVAALH